MVMEHLLVAVLWTAFWLYLYDSVLTGPTWARTLLAGLWGALGVQSQQGDNWIDAGQLTAGVGAGVLGMLLVALLQWLQVARDAQMTSVLRRR